jgi:hypothetical protein
LARRHPGVVLLSLRFLRKISLQALNWSDVPYSEIIPTISRHIFSWIADRHRGAVTVIREALELLLTFSLHPETIDQFRIDILPSLVSLAPLSELHPQIIRLFYQYYVVNDVSDPVRSDSLIHILTCAATAQSGERRLAIMVLAQLSQDRDTALIIGQSPCFTSETLRTMVVDAISSDSAADHTILHLVRNIADRQPALIKGFDTELVAACMQPGRSDDELIDILAIANRAKMTSERARPFAAQRSFIEFLAKLIRRTGAIGQLHLEIVMFVSAISLFAEPAKAVLECGLVELIADIFVLHDDLDMQAQCLFAFQRFFCHSGTRAELLKRGDALERVVKTTASSNAVLNRMANAVVEALDDFDRKSAVQIQLPRFDAFNQEWLEAIGA